MPDSISRKVKAKKLLIGQSLHFSNGVTLIISKISVISESEIKVHCKEGCHDFTMDLMLEDRVEIRNKR